MAERKMIYLDDAIDAVTEGLKGTFVENRDVAEKMLNKVPSAQPETCVYWDRESNICALHRPSAQPEPAIPLSWVENYIEWLKSLDNPFSTLTAVQISSMVKKWKEEQNDGCSQVSERKESDV